MIQNNEKPTTKKILKEAFFYWSQTVFYHVAMSLLYFSVLFLAFYYGAQRFGILDQYLAAAEKISLGQEAYLSELKKIAAGENYQKFYWLFLGTQVFLYPLNLGLLKMFRKIDLGEKPNFQDLFAGYMGGKFFGYISFYLFWILIFNLLLPTVIFAVAWVFATLFCGPLIFFMNRRIFEGTSLSVKAFPRFAPQIIVCVLVAVAVKYIGLFSIAGALFTFPIWNAVVYALYKNIFDEAKK